MSQRKGRVALMALMRCDSTRRSRSACQCPKRKRWLALGDEWIGPSGLEDRGHVRQ